MYIVIGIVVAVIILWAAFRLMSNSGFLGDLANIIVNLVGKLLGLLGGLAKLAGIILFVIVVIWLITFFV